MHHTALHTHTLDCIVLVYIFIAQTLTPLPNEAINTFKPLHGIYMIK